jgi:hypothetical protein
MAYTQEQIDKLVARAEKLYARGSNDDIEVDPITEAEQATCLSPNDDGGVWVRAWVYVRVAEVFGLTCEKCGHQCVPEDGDKVCEKCDPDPMGEGDTWCAACDDHRDDDLRSPTCGHSACRQNYIDTSSTECIQNKGEV